MRARRRGTSLIEVVVSGALLLLIVRSLFCPIQQCSRAAVQSQTRLDAIRLTSAQIEQLRAQPLASLQNSSGTWTVTRNVNGTTRACNYAYTVTISAGAAGVKVVSVNVTWQDGGVERNYSFGTDLVS